MNKEIKEKLNKGTLTMEILEDRLKQIYECYLSEGEILFDGQTIKTEKELLNKLGKMTTYGLVKKVMNSITDERKYELRQSINLDKINELKRKLCYVTNINRDLEDEITDLEDKITDLENDKHDLEKEITKYKLILSFINEITTSHYSTDIIALMKMSNNYYKWQCITELFKGKNDIDFDINLNDINIFDI